MFSVRRYLDEYCSVLARVDETGLERMAHLLAGTWKVNRTVFCCGNGGSAANACHFAADLTKLTAPTHGGRLKAVALTESLSAISAIANDLSYDEIFVEQLRSLLSPHDVVVGFSTSGSSPNVLQAIRYANSVSAFTIGVTGRDGLVLQSLAQHTLIIPSASVQQIEDATMVVGHLLCLRVKELIARASEAKFAEKAILLPGVANAGRAAM